MRLINEIIYNFINLLQKRLFEIKRRNFAESIHYISQTYLC